MVGTIQFIKNNQNQQFEFVQWTVNDKNHIKNVLLPILEKYPPLTSRLHFQLQFLINCIKKNSIQNYLEKKNFKYIHQNDSFSLIHNTNHLPFYFSEWLAGFIEAEGSFCIRKNKNYSFSIAQNNDKYIMKAICKFYSSNVKIQNKSNYKKNHILYEISFSSIKDIYKITNHCKHFLQGYKFLQLTNFIQNNPKLTFIMK